MLWYHISTLTQIAQVRMMLKSAVVDLRKPVMPMREPSREERKMVPMKGVQ